ncbi:hypothetical protein [Nocardia sp. CNY236]|uniref:hypothetical protein n=1 Tax=Nocardia sp. CNY236 TaxID=1169152 RepID=UPI000685C35B|nr:hypothetical protein [Nocardia sp. CNY236]
MSTSSDDGRAITPVGLDLVAPEVYAPMLRRLALAAAGIGVGATLLAAIVMSWTLAVAIGLVVAVPTLVYVFGLRRRQIWLADNVIHARTMFGERRVDVSAMSGVQVLVFPDRVSRVALRITAGAVSQVVPLAMYTDTGSGRELHLLGLRRLADALAVGNSPAAEAVSSLLVQQLRAEARDAGLEDRPLYRAVEMARAKDMVSPVVLTDAEVTALG